DREAGGVVGPPDVPAGRRPGGHGGGDGRAVRDGRARPVHADDRLGRLAALGGRPPDGRPQMTAAQGEGAAPDVLRLYSHFGAFNLKTEDVIAFPSGVPGFEADRRFVLLSAASFEPVQGLQSIDGTS